MKTNKSENQTRKQWFFSIVLFVAVGIIAIGLKTKDLTGIIVLVMFFGSMIYGMSTLIDWEKEK